MSPENRERLTEFLRKKMCGPCRRGELNAEHEGCLEAAELVEIVESD